MNRIYRRIWNAARRCWVVASELSSPRTKAPRCARRPLTHAVTTALLCMVGTVQAQEATECAADDVTCEAVEASWTIASARSFAAQLSSAGTLGTNDTVYGSSASTSGDNNAVFGRIAGARGDGTAMGYSANAKGFGAVSVGRSSSADAENSIALGRNAFITSTSASGAIAIGAGARAGSQYASGAIAVGAGASAKQDSVALGYGALANLGQSVAIGTNSSAGDYSAALGHSASASGNDSVALGYRSTASAYRVVSVGSETLKRRIVNVDDGQISSTSSDAVTGKQLYRVQAASTDALSIARSAQSGVTTLNGLISTGCDGCNVRIGIGSTSPILDVRNSSGASRRIYGVAEGDVTAESRNAINGKQLFETNNAVTAAQRTATIASTNAEAALIKAERLSGLVSGDSTTFRLGAENSASSMNVAAKNGSNRLVTGVADGSLTAASRDAVNGGQLYTTHQAAISAKSAAEAAMREIGKTAYTLASGTELTEDTRAKATATAALAFGQSAHASGWAALAAGRNARAFAQGSIALGDGARVLSDASLNSIAFGTNAATGVQAGLIAFGSRSVATGGENAMALGTGASASSSNSVALGAGSTTSAEKQVSVGSSQIKRTLVNLADGKLTQTSSEAVTGSQLFGTNLRVGSLEGLIRQDSQAGTMRLGGENSGALVDVRNKANGNRKITGVADAELKTGSSDAVTGGQLAATNGRLSAALDGASEALAKITGIETQTQYFKVGGKGPGIPAQAGAVGVALGDSAEASLLSEGGVALGSFAKARGRNSVALGRASRVDETADGGFALGVLSSVAEVGGVALGQSSSVQKGAENAVAIGAGSIATEGRTASFGNAGLQRRLTNLARGTADHNATTVGQLNDSLAALGGGAKLDAVGNVTAPTYTVQNTRQHTVGDALTVLDGAVLRTTSRMDRVEGQLRSVFQDTPTARADGLNQIALAGANGMILSNVGNGLIAAGSRDAVNGGQLHSMQQQLNGRMDGLEQRIDGQPQSRMMALASDEPGTPATPPVAEEPAPPASNDDKIVANTGNAPKSSPQPKAEAPESPKPQVDTAELEKMLARANDYSDGIAREVDARLNKMDKRFNRMAAMSSAQTAMAMNTAGLATYNRLGAGVGYAEGESAMAVGYQRVLNEKGSATFSLNGAFTNSGERSMGVGVGIGW